MYGLKHRVEGEEGLAGNPEPFNMVRYAARCFVASGLLAVCVGFSGWLHGSAFFYTLGILLLIVGIGTLVFETPVQNRLSHWRR